MKILDKYVIKNFLIGYAVAFGVLMGLRTIIDLFVNLDEFTEQSSRGTWAVIENMLAYYALNSTLYFRDFAGMITVVAASFSFGRMVRSSELVAVMASGVSLKRLIGPIVLLAVLLTGLLVIDQELIIPPLAPKLVRDRDAVRGQESYDVWFMSDGSGSLICSQRFDVETATLHSPTIITRRTKPQPQQWEWEVTGLIRASSATYNPKTGLWDLHNGQFIEKNSRKGAQAITSYDAGGLTPQEIPIRRTAEYKTLLGSRQLTNLAAQETKIKDMAQLWSQKHFRITDPLINLVMLMLSLPLLVCRDPKSMKSAVMISFAATGACFVITFVCKILATEVVFDRVMPELWAWLPIFIFLPIAFIEFDSMKT
ncbi:MAG: LptF/LptG family permease [Sedimentisphaerales bacterium]|nr:LptF/LptG family permease [Sedimentisphaerales bacterium]